MKVVKYIFTLVLAFCAITSITNAQITVHWMGGGSSAAFQELGQAAFDAVNLAPTALTPGNGCLWSHSKTSSGGTPDITAADNRTGVGTLDRGDWFVAYDGASPGCAGGTPAANARIYAYLKLDSVVGDRCYFENDGTGTSGCVLGLANMTTNGTNVISTQPDVPGGIVLNSSIISALQAHPHFFVAGTDIRPEDAKFQVTRALTRCDTYLPRQFFNNDSYYLLGLGYQTANPNVGTTILGAASYGGGSFAVANFNITGFDPINTSAPVPAYSVSTIGAQPMIIALSPISDGNLAGIKDINSATLALFSQGVLGRTNDLLGVGTAEALQFLVREHMSGTYNTYEYSLPQSTQFHSGQESGACGASGVVSASGNPMLINSAAGNVPGAVRARVIGTGNGTAGNGTTGNLQFPVGGIPSLGYFFWSAGNAKPLTNVKYLLLNGIDPLLADNSYSHGGILPGSTGTYASALCTGGTCTDPGLSAVTFTGLNAGDYAIWSALRIVSPPGDPGTSDILTQLNTNVNGTQHDYIAPSAMNIWHSHFFINGEASAIPTPANGPTVGTTVLCAGGSAEQGGDAGGSTLLIINNKNFCADFASTQGKLNLTF